MGGKEPKDTYAIWSRGKLEHLPSGRHGGETFYSDASRAGLGLFARNREDEYDNRGR